MSLEHATTSVSTHEIVTREIVELSDSLNLDPTAFASAYERALSQLAQLRLIADRAALAAISEMDMETTPTDEVELIGRYLDKTNYLDDLDDGMTFITGVIRPLLDPEIAPLMDYVTVANRDEARKKRIREELGQLKVMSHKIEEVDLVSNLIRVELKAAELALLFALSDVTSKSLLMSLSPSVRIAQHLTDVRRESGGNPQIDWSKGSENIVNQGEGTDSPTATS